MFTDYEALCKELLKVHELVSGASIKNEEEGAVIYLVRRSIDGAVEGKDEVLSLCKLKTLEYRLFLKIREKLRNYAKTDRRNEAYQRHKVNDFLKESRSLIGSRLKLPRHLDYYEAVMREALFNIDESIEMENLLFNAYVDFLEEITAVVNKNGRSHNFESGEMKLNKNK